MLFPSSSASLLFHFPFPLSILVPHLTYLSSYILVSSKLFQLLSNSYTTDAEASNSPDEPECYHTLGPQVELRI
jgi:hypothetical protein